VLLCRNNIFGLQEENIQTICGIFISIMGLLTLLFSCIPFNKYRSLVYFTMCLCTFLVIFVPFGKNISGFATYSLDTISVIVLIAAILIYGGLFVVMNYLFKLGIRKYEEKQNKN
jgi:hypothetical protein